MKSNKLVLMSGEGSESDESFVSFEPTVEPLFVRDVLNVLSGDLRKFGSVEDLGEWLEYMNDDNISGDGWSGFLWEVGMSELVECVYKASGKDWEEMQDYFLRSGLLDGMMREMFVLLEEFLLEKRGLDSLVEDVVEVLEREDNQVWMERS